MPLDPHLAERLHLLAGLTFPDLADPDAQARFAEFMRDPSEWTRPADVVVEDREIPGPHGPVPVRSYVPGRPGSAAVLWAHGGGFLGGDLDMPEAHVVAAELAARAGAVVVSVDYRLAVGGVRYPVPLDDVCAAWRWLRTELAPDADVVALGGASAGAALALATALRDRDEALRPADLLLLAYPFAHFPVPALDSATAAEMAALPPTMRFTTRDIEFMVENYVGRLTDLPRDALPGAAALRGLPPVHVLVCEYDDLRPSAELLVRQLTASEVEVRSSLAAGMPHGHLNRTPALAEVGRSLDLFADALRRRTPLAVRGGPCEGGPPRVREQRAAVCGPGPRTGREGAGRDGLRWWGTVRDG
ncbi:MULTISPECIES: alpha/beta hydrolase fold domain-containing protein [Streptomyces]|uniref:Putative acetyl esterase n=1 Tax=Streptomyces scabiei (strain 87.22) TaxID=680198 RepID=C9Z375_STRSW|nr:MULTISPECIES: alpha/beta hydrolase [Streptomyces]MBP5865791.1 alpha/beta hydrolase [Streptomyces sp. LBUM 1484]KFG04122.1 acetyl esterase [Streptomyces scabiei]MBP5895944.1 alpha/beta hydrolase [Streptomyces sp. LBUM 1481]MBP5896945.1 alpha/beta hydrolase [Streptomyces sp. LBUM 1488]MDW8470569.1 alpha/beta hydrolase [Streptomyces scabiei]